MVGEYWRFIFRRAFKEACAAVYLDTRERIVIGAVVAIGGIVFLVLWGSSADASHDEVILRMGGAFVTFALLIFFYAWKVVSVPAHLHGEQRAMIQDFQGRLQPKLSLSLGDGQSAMIEYGVTHISQSGLAKV